MKQDPWAFMLCLITQKQFRSMCTEWPKMALNTKRSKVPYIHVITMPNSNFTLFCCTASRFWVTGHFGKYMYTEWQVHWMFKWPWRLKLSQRYPMFIWQLPPSSKFHFVSLYGNEFSSYRLFWDQCAEWPQHDLKHIKDHKYHILYACYNYPLVPNFTRFCSTVHRFWATGHFETSARNDQKKITLNTERSKVPHIHVTTIQSHKFHSISLYMYYELQDILMTCAQTDPKITLNTERSKVPHIYVV